MTQSQESEAFDIPGIGEFRAKPGTATAELAGAVKVWHDKSKTAYSDGRTVGLIAGGALVLFAELLAIALYLYLRT